MRSIPLGPNATVYITAGAGAPAPYGVGNFGPHVGDDPSAVAARRRALAARLGPVSWMTQVHGCVVVDATEPGEVGQADALVTDRPELALAVMVADCAPVLLASESGRVRAAVHVGRAGLVSGVLPAALTRMRHYTSEPIYAAIGPHICAGCYEVSEELASEAAAYGARDVTRWHTPAVNLTAGIRGQLGPAAQIVEDERCTFESPELYSYRRDRVTGRFVGVVVPTRRDR